MELLNRLCKLMSLVLVLGTIISMGFSLTMAQITGPLRNLHLVIMGLLSNFVEVPVVAVILTQVIPLDEALVTKQILMPLAGEFGKRSQRPA